MLPLFWKVTPSLDCFSQITPHFHVHYANLTRKSSVPAVFDLHFLEMPDDKKTPPLFHFRVRETIVQWCPCVDSGFSQSIWRH